MAVTLERVGQRVYFRGDTFAVKGDIKSMGGHWDGDARAWWVGAKKAAEAEALVARLNAPPPAPPEMAAAAGLDPTAPAGVVADKLEESGQGTPEQLAALRSPPAKPREDPDSIRLTGKGRYKGRIYYCGAITRDGTRVRLLTLPDAEGKFLDFWADCAQVEEIKRYQPREVWDGRRNSGRTRTVYTTLGSIAEFLHRQANPETARGQCTECDAWGPRGEPCTECGGEGTYA